MAKIKPLKQSPLFRTLSDREIAIFSQIVDEIKLADGDALLPVYEGLVLVKRGRIAVNYATSENAPVNFEIGAGESLGELVLLSGKHVDAEETTLQAAALGECEILFVSPPRFAGLVEEEPVVCFKIIQALTGALQKRFIKQHEVLAKMMKDVVYE